MTEGDQAETDKKPEVDVSGDWVPKFQGVDATSQVWHWLIKIAMSRKIPGPKCNDWVMHRVTDPVALVAKCRETLKAYAARTGRPYVETTYRSPTDPQMPSQVRDKKNPYWHVGFFFGDGAVVARGQIDAHCIVDVCSLDHDLSAELYEAIYPLDLDAIPDDEYLPGVDILVRTPGGLGFESQSVPLHAFEPSNYMPDVVDAYDRICQELPGGDRGRLVVLEGPPGTGKTHFINGLIRALSVAEETTGKKKPNGKPERTWVTAGRMRFVMVSANMTEDLAGPTMLPLLIAHRRKHGVPICIVVEDADALLVSRMADNAAGISTILNLADGIQSMAADVRFVMTTNRKIGDVDAALRRKGRMLLHQHVGPLTGEKLVAAWKRLHGEAKPRGLDATPVTAQDKMTLAEVYAGEREDKLSRKLGLDTGR